MKKFLAIAACASAVMLTGCIAGVCTSNGGVSVLGCGLYSETAGNAMLQPTVRKDYTVVKRDVTASADLLSVFALVNFGDASYSTLKAAALQQAPGANDLIDVKMDYQMNNIIGINKVKVTMTATAVKFDK